MAAGEDVSLGIQNEVLAALFAEWGLTRPDVICHDFGAATVLRAHYLNGLSYRDVVVFDAVALCPWGSPFVAHVRNFEPAFAGLPDYAHAALLRAYLQGAAHLPLSDVAMAIHSAPWLGPVGQAAFYRQIAQMDMVFTREIEHRLDRFADRIRVLWGAMDAWIPVETGRRFARMVSDLPLIEVPRCGHLMQEDAPEAIVAAALSFRTT
jgi:pimeloyl-ACP methyl ester carboxylesterase